MTQATPDTGRDSTPVLELQGVSKRFGSTLALDCVHLSLHPGEIVGLLGHNGSGKSTLVGVLAGAHAPEPGARAWLNGVPKSFPLRRQETRLGVVPQDLGLVEKLTVLENLNIGQRIAPRGPARWMINWSGERQQARALLAGYGVSIPLRSTVDQLSLLDRAMLAIVRCARDLASARQGSGAAHGIMVLDEPTVFLPHQEKEFLFELVRRNAAQGTAVVIISHDLSVIRELAQRSVVLRNGRIVAEVDMPQVTERDLVDLIIGATPASPGGVS
jgi:ribose transport system ATP-binding protein